MAATGFQSLRGFAGYVRAMRMFSRNARLYLLHIFGMDVIHGTWEVIFNLYLLELGFSIQFIGLRLAVMGIASVAASVPAGWLSDRIGRKWGFILGDGGGALFALVQITTTSPAVLLVAPAFAAAFGSLHHVTESPFMAENSEPAERIHLFSVGSGFRTLAAMAGALLAGFFPTWLADAAGLEKVVAFRLATYIGIAWWFLSLVPAVMLRPYVSDEMAQATKEPRRFGLLGNVRSHATIRKFLVVGALIALGGGFVLRLVNVFFREGIHAHEQQIGITFAAGSLFLALAAFTAPFVVERFGKVRSIYLTRLASIPFILIIGFAPELATPVSVVSLAGAAFVLRTVLFNMSGPVYEAFSMEQLHPSERGTFTGLEALVDSGAAALAGYVGASMMDQGDFQTPFVMMAVLYALSTLLFRRYFEASARATDLEVRLASSDAEA